MNKFDAKYCLNCPHAKLILGKKSCELVRAQFNNILGVEKEIKTIISKDALEAALSDSVINFIRSKQAIQKAARLGYVPDCLDENEIEQREKDIESSWNLENENLVLPKECPYYLEYTLNGVL